MSNNIGSMYIESNMRQLTNILHLSSTLPLALSMTQIVTIAIYSRIFMFIDDVVRHQEIHTCFPFSLIINHLCKKFHVEHTTHSDLSVILPRTRHMVSLCCPYIDRIPLLLSGG